jgi:hypothetical protein
MRARGRPVIAPAGSGVRHQISSRLADAAAGVDRGVRQVHRQDA